MTRSSQARIMRKKSEKLRAKAKRELMMDYPKMMEDKAQRDKIFEMVDNANVGVDRSGKFQIFYDNLKENKDLINLK